MPEIIPNYHPLLVHFTIALLSMSVVFYIIRLCLPASHPWRAQWLNAANWNLWTGCFFAIVTVLAGWFAYNSVAHDAPSHEAMTLHRNWAIPTAVLFLFIGVSSVRLTLMNRQPGIKFISASIVAVMLLMVTGWLGAEAVYRYGLGVMSLPDVETGADGHSHSHSAEPTAGESVHQPDGHSHGAEPAAGEHVHESNGHTH